MRSITMADPKRTILAAILFVFCASSARSQQEPIVAEAQLECGAAKVKPLRVMPHRPYEFAAGSRRFVIDGNTVRETEGETGNELASLKSPDNLGLRWLTATKDRIFFLSVSLHPNNESIARHASPCIHRLSLAGRTWLAPLEAGEEKDDSSKRHQAFVSFLADDKNVLLLTYLLEPSDKHPRDERLVGYRLTCFKSDCEKPAWVRTYPWTGNQLLSNVVASFPAFANASEAVWPAMAWCGDYYVVIAASPQQTLISLDRENGVELWSKARIWEFARGHAHPKLGVEITRFGLPSLPGFDEDAEALKKKQDAALADARQNMEKMFVASLVTGPMIIRTNDGLRIYVATQQTPRASWGPVAADCTVYELDSGGEFLAMTKLPRPARAFLNQGTADGIVLGCGASGVARLIATKLPDWSSLRVFPFLGDFSDKTCQIDWYRELRATDNQPWLRESWTGGCACFSKEYYFCVHEPCYVQSDGDTVFRVPISVVSISTGRETTLTLILPFEKPLTLPQVNVTKVGKTTIPLISNYPAITWMQGDGEKLRFFIGTNACGSTHSVIDFDLTQLPISAGNK